MAEEQPILEDVQVEATSRGSLMNILLVVVLIMIAGVGGYFVQDLISENTVSKAPSSIRDSATGTTRSWSHGPFGTLYGEPGEDQGEPDA
jgi:hypothetical protein